MGGAFPEDPVGAHFERVVVIVMWTGESASAFQAASAGQLATPTVEQMPFLSGFSRTIPTLGEGEKRDPDTRRAGNGSGREQTGKRRS